jgi:hypothetical protein
MTQFLRFDKLTTSSFTNKQPIIVNKSSILLVEKEVLEDKLYRTTFTASRVHIIGYPEYTFYTLASMESIESILDAVDVTQGIQTGVSSCDGTPGMLDIVNLEGSLPALRLNRIKNNVKADVVPYMCNPNYLLYAEETPFQDEVTEQQTTYLALVFRGIPTRRVPTRLSIDDLSTLLKAIPVQ